MRFIAVVVLPLAGCSGEANHLGNLFTLPLSGLSTAAENAVYNERRGRVEVFVKTNHDVLLRQIAQGGGAELSEVMDIAGIPVGDRPARLIQMQGDLGLFRNSPDALIVSLMVYGG